MSKGEGREMRVVVEGGKQEVERLTKRVDELEPKAREHDKLIFGLIENLNKKWNTDEFSEMETMEDLRILDGQFEEAELQDKRNRRPASKGTVSLHNPRARENEILSREYDDPEELMKDLYEEWKNEENAEKRIQLRSYINQLLKKRDKDDSAFRNIKWVFDRTPKGLNPKAGWREYTQFVQEKNKAELERQKR